MATPSQPKLTPASTIFIVLGLAVSIYLLANLPSSSSGSGSTASSITNESLGSPEYNLAVIATGSEITDASPELAQFRSVLNDIEAKVPEDRTQISDMIVNGWKLLKESGHEESLLPFARNLEQAIPTGTKIAFSDVVTSYVMLRRGGVKAGPNQ